NFDGLVITSANVVRHGGPGLETLKELPVHAVGQATAAAARTAGFGVATVGEGNATELLARLSPSLRLLPLAWQDHRDPGVPRIDGRIVYRAAEIVEPNLPDLDGLVVAVHSPRAGARLSVLATDRNHTIIAAISASPAGACGSGWERIDSAPEPNDNSLLAL